MLQISVKQDTLSLLRTSNHGNYDTEETAYPNKQLLNSYMHLYIPSNPETTSWILTP